MTSKQRQLRAGMKRWEPIARQVVRDQEQRLESIEGLVGIRQEASLDNPPRNEDIHDLHYVDYIPGLEPAPRAGHDLAKGSPAVTIPPAWEDMVANGSAKIGYNKEWDTGSTQVSDLAAADPDKHHGAFKSAQKKEEAIKQFLKDVYRDGAEGNNRSLAADLETIRKLT